MSIQSGKIEEFLTVAEVAEILKINQQTVRNWIDQGSLPALKVGRRVRIKRSDLERVLDEGYVTGNSGAGRETAPSAEDFWGGEPVGTAEPPVAAEQPLDTANLAQDRDLAASHEPEVV